MHNSRKVVWTEGMFLTPHHFQQWDRYYGDLVSQRFRFLNPFGWGCAELNIDRDGLSNETFSLLSLKGVFPDGLLVSIPDEGPSPPTRPFNEHFAADLDHLDVYVGIAVERPGRANVLEDDESKIRPTRFALEYTKVSDGNTGENAREIAVARKNWKIFFSGEEMGDYVTLKIAELVRTPGGTVALRDTYIPPCIAISSSSYLMRLVQGLLELLIAKKRSLAVLQSATTGLGYQEGSKTSLLYTLNASIPILSHASRQGFVHPEQLYLALSRLTGELTTFSSAVQPEDLPHYEHTNLSAMFTVLEGEIRILLEGVDKTQVVTIPLEAGRHNQLFGEIPDELLSDSFQLYLSVSGDLPGDQSRDVISKRIKVGSKQELDAIVNSAMPGVSLTHNLHPPTSLPVEEETLYFRLEKGGDYWDSICRSHSVAFFVPADLRGIRLELFATKE